MIKGLNAKKARGPDKILVRIVKLGASVIDSHLTNIINNDISNNAFQDSEKLASVEPIYKKGDRDYIKNYRPARNLNSFSKIHEKVLNLCLHTEVDIVRIMFSFDLLKLETCIR